MTAQGKNGERWLTAIFAVGLIGVILFNIVIVLRGTIQAFNSDSATAILLAREQMLTGQIIPDGWHYANDIWVFTLNLFCIPFMLFIDNWMLCRELAVILQMLLVTGAIIVYVRKIADIKWALMAAALFWCPISVVTREHFLFQATYATIILQTLVVLIGMHGFLEKNGKDCLLYGVLVGGTAFLLSMGGIRFVGATAVPIVGAVGLMLLMQIDFDLRKLLKAPYREVVLKLCIFLFMCVAGYIVHLKIRSTGAISSYTMMLIGDGNIWEKIGNLFQYHMKVWGCFDASVFFSVNGILGFLRFVACVVMNILAPVYVLIRYKHLDSGLAKFFVLYAILSAIVCDYLLVFTDMCNDYYLLPIYFNQCILTVIALQDLIRWKKNMVQTLCVLCIIPFCLMNGLYYATRDYGKGEADYALIDLLEENELYFGCSGVFWDTYKYTVLSDGRVEIVSYADQPENPNLWLCSESWYEAGHYEGKSFILIRNGWTELSQEWKSLAQEVIPYGEFSIYVYPENIYKIAGK